MRSWWGEVEVARRKEAALAVVRARLPKRKLKEVRWISGLRGKKWQSGAHTFYTHTHAHRTRRHRALFTETLRSEKTRASCLGVRHERNRVQLETSWSPKCRCKNRLGKGMLQNGRSYRTFKKAALLDVANVFPRLFLRPRTGARSCTL